MLTKDPCLQVAFFQLAIEVYNLLLMEGSNEMDVDCGNDARNGSAIAAKMWKKSQDCD